jgi:integrase
LRVFDDRGATQMRDNVRMWIRHMFEYAVDHEEHAIQTNPAPSGRNKSFQVRKGGHFPAITDPDQFIKMMNVIFNHKSTITRTLLIFSAHVFQRPTEVRFSTWKEFDLEKRMWVIPAARMKKRREHWVPLSDVVANLLKVHQGVVGDDPEGYLFPGREVGKPVSEGTATKMLNDNGFKGLHCPHGFRASARTILDERIKIDTRFLEKQLSHEEGDSLKNAYNRAEHWEGRVQMMEIWSNWINHGRPPLVE